MKKYLTLALIVVFACSLNAQHETTTNDLPNKRTKAQLEEKDHRVYLSTLFKVPLYTKTQSAIYQLDSMKAESYDNSNSTWYVNDLEILEYNGNKQCISETDYDFYQGTREKDYINWYSYDTDGNFVEEIGANWYNGQWDSSWREVYSYNAANQYLGEIEYDYYNGAWEEYWKSEYSYDANGFLVKIEYFDWDSGAWDPYRKEELANHADGRVKCEVEYYHNGSSYEREDSTYYTYNSSQLLISRLRYEWDSPGWEEDHLYEYSYYSNGDLNERVSYYKYSFASAWDTSYKYIYTYSSPGYVSERVEQDWENGSWVNYYKDTYTYDENYVYPQFAANPYYLDDDWQMYLTEFEYYWDDDDSVWDLEYKDFFYWSHTGFSVAEEAMNSIRIYPVPTKNNLNIELLAGKTFTYQLYDLHGRLLVNDEVESNETIVDLESVTSGLYLLEINAEGERTVHRVLVQ